MIGNFIIKAGSTQPWLTVQIKKDGFVDLNLEAPKPKGCGPQCADPDDNVDLTNATVKFNLFAAGRTPQPVAVIGETVISDADCSEVTHQWDISETSTPGIFYGQFEITLKDQTLLLWPYEMEQLTIEVF